MNLSCSKLSHWWTRKLAHFISTQHIRQISVYLCTSRLQWNNRRNTFFKPNQLGNSQAAREICKAHLRELTNQCNRFVVELLLLRRQSVLRYFQTDAAMPQGRIQPRPGLLNSGCQCVPGLPWTTLNIPMNSRLMSHYSYLPIPKIQMCIKEVMAKSNQGRQRIGSLQHVSFAYQPRGPTDSMPHLVGNPANIVGVVGFVHYGESILDTTMHWDVHSGPSQAQQGPARIWAAVPAARWTAGAVGTYSTPMFWWVAHPIWTAFMMRMRCLVHNS